MAAEQPPTGRFRRRPFEAPHRRRRLAVRLVRPFLAALLLVGAPAGAAIWLLYGDRLVLRRIEVTGCERVECEWVRVSLRPLLGRQLLWLDFREIERRLLAHPWIRGVAVRKELPDRLAVEIVERRPAARLASGGDVLLVDGEGTIIVAYDGDRHPADLPLLLGMEDPGREVPRALALAERWRAGRGDRGPAEIEQVGESDYRVRCPTLRFPVLVGPDNLDAALERLERLLPGIERRYPAIEQLDLRFERQIVVQSAAEPRTQEG